MEKYWNREVQYLCQLLPTQATTNYTGQPWQRMSTSFARSLKL